MYSQRVVCCFIVCVLVTSSVQAQESSSWWPFGESDKTETRSSSYFGSKPKATAKSGSSSSWFKWPSFKSKSKPKSPSVVSRATKTSKKWWDNTVDFMNPFNDSKPASKPAHGYQTPSWSNRSKPEEEKRSGLFSWMWVEEKVDESPTTVNGWQAQSTPDFFN